MQVRDNGGLDQGGRSGRRILDTYWRYGRRDLLMQWMWYIKVESGMTLKFLASAPGQM